jgi:UDP-glucose 4-epimerase
MNVLVTGGLGVNGSWVTTKLVARGLRPVVLENRLDYSLVGDDVRRNAIFVEGDVTDEAFVRATLREYRIERIIHMAALIIGLDADPLRAFRVNAQATIQLLDAAVAAGIERVVFTSSRAVYGDVTGEFAHPVYRPVDENHPVNPIAIYDVCKVACEGMGRNYARTTGLSFVALRFAQIYGPGKLQRHGNYGVLSRLIESSLAGEPIAIPQGGDQRDDIIYVDDVAEAVVVATLHPHPNYDAYNISQGAGVSLFEFAGVVRDLVPDANIDIGPGVDYMQLGAQYYAVLANQRARDDLDFVPRFGLRDGVADYIRRVREMQLPLVH